MTYFEFVRLVGEMRGAQRRYFVGRERSDLAESKALEARVDRELRVYEKQLLAEGLAGGGEGEE